MKKNATMRAMADVSWRVKTVCLVVLTALLTPAAWPYTIEYYLGKPIKDKDGSITYRAGSGSFPAGIRRDAAQFAFNQWNAGPGKFHFNTPYYGDTNQARYNGQNEMWFTSNSKVIGTAPAKCIKTYAYTLNPHIIEADVVFNSGVDWSFSTIQSNKWRYGGSYRPFISTLMHEAGHAMGLKHNNYSYNIMGEDWTHVHVNDGIFRPYSGEDASAGEVFLFGADSPARNDLGVSHWKYSKADGEYSEHTNCGIYNPGSSLVDADEVNEQPRYWVSRNSNYEVQFTYENNGKNVINNVDVGFYISKNDRITTLDDRIGGTVFGTISPGAPATLKRVVKIPNGLTVGQTYYLGAIVDETGEVSEFRETNNATWLQIYIRS